MPAPDRKRRLTAFVVAMAVLIATPLAVVAADAFNDVPNSNVHHEDITWLKDAGVTLGCNPPDNTEFCPGDPVLRQQMASFMRRLAENQVVDAATALEADHATTADSATSADNADTLDGSDPDELAPKLFADGDQSSGGTAVTASGRIDVNTVEVDAPLDGFVVVSGRIFINNESGAERQYALNIKVDGDDALPQDWAAVTSFETGTEQNRGNIDYTVTIPITAGTHTITQEAGPYSGTADFFYNQEALTAVYFPNTIGSLALSTAGSAGGSQQGD